MRQILFSEPFLILINNPEQPMHATNFFESKIFWKRIIKNKKGAWN